MKVINYIEPQFTLGKRTATKIFYEDGTERVTKTGDKRTKEQTREIMFYTIKRFNKKLGKD